MKKGNGTHGGPYGDSDSCGTRKRGCDENGHDGP